MIESSPTSIIEVFQILQNIILPWFRVHIDPTLHAMACARLKTSSDVMNWVGHCNLDTWDEVPQAVTMNKGVTFAQRCGDKQTPRTSIA